MHPRSTLGRVFYYRMKRMDALGYEEAQFPGVLEHVRTSCSATTLTSSGPVCLWNDE